MESHKPQFWFRAKRYGLGWGLPARWQGWFVLGLYFGALYFAADYFKPKNERAGFIIFFTVASAMLVAIIAWKGEKPMVWRWGDK